MLSTLQKFVSLQGRSIRCLVSKAIAGDAQEVKAIFLVHWKITTMHFFFTFG